MENVDRFDFAVLIMNNPFDYTPDKACEDAFKNLLVRLEALKKSHRPEDINFCRELEDGKMLGVLVAVDAVGEDHVLYAFSGQLGGGGFYHEGFVGPVYDYLRPDGYFKRGEAEISRQNEEIALFENGTLAQTRNEYELAKHRLNVEVAEYREKCRLSKLERDARRNSGQATDEELAKMIGQSQFEKAELYRLKKRMTAQMNPLETELQVAQSRLDDMKEKRRIDSENLQNRLFSDFRLLNARGETHSLSEIFAGTSMKIPPSGAGECCAPKLLQEAYRRGWLPVSIAEYWYGKPKGGEVRIHGAHYPACRGKCLPVLGWMLQGLTIEPPLESQAVAVGTPDPEIIFENQWFCVINKPCGMLSVPGKESAVSLQEWLACRYGPDVKMAHRLDRDTSGLIIAAFGQKSYAMLQKLFATREMAKSYIADLDGDYRAAGIPPEGLIELPISPDWLDRPRQRVDIENGKAAVTKYQFTDVSNGRSRVVFYPLTGRTHQLRVHAASGMGLGLPIVGDPLYGKNLCSGHERLHLHAQKIEFTFPIDSHHYCFESAVPF